jgi:hypothetical protein
VLAWLDELLQSRRHRRRHRRGLAALLPAGAGLHVQAGELLVLPPPPTEGGSLRAIVVEVNNTFGERHCYLLDAPRWRRTDARKVFHVSPFLRVEGEYRFRFLRTGGTDVSAPWCASTTTTPMARCCRPASAARCSRSPGVIRRRGAVAPPG